MHHIMMLQQQHLELLLTSAIQGYQHALLNNITLLGAHDLDKIGLMDLVISRWPCQGLSHASISQGLSDPRSRLLWELIWVLQYLQTSYKLHSFACVGKCPTFGGFSANHIGSMATN
jgi:site-specific DNA-cytosine methylase